MRFALAVTAIVGASWLPVLIGSMTRAVAGWLAAVVLALAIGWLSRRFTVGVLVCGLVLASAFVASGLVSDPTHYMPVAVAGGALGVRTAAEAWRSRRVNSLTPRLVMIAVGLYLAWAAVTTLTSIDHRVSGLYLVGMIAICALAFWTIPAALAEQSDRENLLASTGVLGVVVALSVYVVEVTGSLKIFGRPVGAYLLADLTIGGHSTGLHFARSAGVYLAPLEAAITMVLGVVMLFAWSATRSGRPRLLAWVGVAIMLPAIMLTLDRTAWLAAIVALGALVLVAPRRRFHAAVLAAVCVVFAAIFLFVFVGGLGANVVSDVCTANCSAGTGEGALRGGTGLTGREVLWRASIKAIENRPLFGYGPGNNVPALYPFLAGGAYHIDTLTSHSTWFRTAVEMGVPGLGFLVWVLVAVAGVFIGALRRRRSEVDPVNLALAAAVCGLVPAMTFESFLLGGVTFTSLFLALALGLIAIPLTRTTRV
jgi:O-antigen ligase